jgi:hypothetical protein
MNTNERETLCANGGCGRAAEEDSRLCAECNLEWSLFHRETRADSDTGAEFPFPEPERTIQAPTA